MKSTNSIDLVKARQFSRQQGASLLEGIAYLGIAAIVVLGAVSLLTGAFGSAKSNQTTEEIISLRTAVRKMHTGQAYTNGNMVANLITANAIPNTLTINRAANTVTNSWAGAVTVTGNPAAGNFTITYNDLPQDVCISAISGANGWDQISNAGGGAAITAFPATPTAAAGLCGGASNDISFRAL